MAENPKALRRRIRSVQNTRKITSTMEMIAASKLRRVQQAMTAARAYAEKIEATVQRLAQTETAGQLPLFETRSGGTVTVVAIASDRGLCGGYNAAALREADRAIRSIGPDEQVRAIAIGRRAEAHFKKRGYNMVDAITNLGGAIDVEMAHGLCDRLVKSFLSGESNRIVLVYNHFVSTLNYEPISRQLLPLGLEDLRPAEEEPGYHMSVEYIYEPSAQEVFAELLPRYTRTRVYATLLEAMTAEHSARRIAMNNATENSEEMIDALTLRANKARQAAITTEILEIVGGAEALKG